MTLLYFAYGSNLNPAQMRSRCPESRIIGPAFLDGFGLAFGGWTERWQGAVATVWPRAGARTWGALYALSEDDMARLDRWENVPEAYVRLALPVTPMGSAAGTPPLAGEPTLAQVYRFAQPREVGAPSPPYRSIIEDAFRRYGFPLETLDTALAASGARREEES